MHKHFAPTGRSVPRLPFTIRHDCSTMKVIPPMKKLTVRSGYNTSKELNQARRDARARMRRRKPKQPLLKAAEYVPETVLIKK